MKRRPKQSQTRQHVAQVAAKLIIKQGVNDFDLAKKKAVKSLGLSSVQQHILPTHAEIEAEVVNYQRLFNCPKRENYVTVLRQKAVHGMKLLKDFQPQLTGMVLQGTATLNSPISLHVYADTSEEVMIHLINHNIPYDITEQRVTLLSKQVKTFPMFRFYLAESPIEVTVFPEDNLKFLPRCSVKGEGVARASLGEVMDLVDKETPQ